MTDIAISPTPKLLECPICKGFGVLLVPGDGGLTEYLCDDCHGRGLVLQEVRQAER